MKREKIHSPLVLSRRTDYNDLNISPCWKNKNYFLQVIIIFFQVIVWTVQNYPQIKHFPKFPLIKYEEISQIIERRYMREESNQQ